ncbi:ABC transporter ATP-binding protein [Acetivibrio cellulolyticus]|uniref:ABC transporter ATP-binding protein n=1 Tax=Acetivibrio cellulolyticus TaxID=35830 RepID=UPI0001E2C2DF|nr:ABC transporter ATP-binding protein [Acetivibrio cellulolyticus]
MNKIIELKGVSKSFELANTKVKVLENINLEIEEGEFISIMGPSGSGKSTLLYLIGGLDKASEGAILVNGVEMRKLSDNLESKIRRNDMGFIFQAYNLIDNLTLEENILLPALLEGKKKKAVLRKAEELMDIVGILHRRNHTPKELSGGEQQRTAIARALINDPDILFADEPIGNLDSKSGTEVLELLGKINKERGITILMVTHSEESTRYGNRIIRLKDGRIIA